MNCYKGCICYTYLPNMQCAFEHLGHLPPAPLRITQLEIFKDNITHIRSGDFESAGLLHLQVIILTLVGLRSLSPGAFTNMKNLSTLTVSNNSLQSLESATFCGADSLQQLNLSSNAIEQMEVNVFCELKSLLSLNLDSNHLTKLHSGSFQGLGDLKVLTLRKNRIEAFTNKDVFRHLSNISFLDLTGNQIKTLSANVFTGMTRLLLLYLSDNDLTCDCELRELWLWCEENSVGSVAECAKPAQLVRQSWIVLEQATCSPSNVTRASVLTLLVLCLLQMGSKLRF